MLQLTPFVPGVATVGSLAGKPSTSGQSMIVPVNLKAPDGTLSTVQMRAMVGPSGVTLYSLEGAGNKDKQPQASRRDSQDSAMSQDTAAATLSTATAAQITKPTAVLTKPVVAATSSFVRNPPPVSRVTSFADEPKLLIDEDDDDDDLSFEDQMKIQRRNKLLRLVGWNLDFQI